MKTLFIMFDDETGTEGAFDDNGELIHAWHENDANWRDEYFNPVLAALGYEVVRVETNDNAFKDQLRYFFGDQE